MSKDKEEVVRLSGYRVGLPNDATWKDTHPEIELPVSLIKQLQEAGSAKLLQLVINKYEDTSDYLKEYNALLQRYIQQRDLLARLAKKEASREMRYKKALNNIVWEAIPSTIDKEQLKVNLKIAAGL